MKKGQSSNYSAEIEPCNLRFQALIEDFAEGILWTELESVVHVHCVDERADAPTDEGIPRELREDRPLYLLEFWGHINHL